jgi:hypothetical protein
MPVFLGIDDAVASPYFLHWNGKLTRLEERGREEGGREGERLTAFSGGSNRNVSIPNFK